MIIINFIIIVSIFCIDSFYLFILNIVINKNEIYYNIKNLYKK
jgi:hypothetical protein